VKRLGLSLTLSLTLAIGLLATPSARAEPPVDVKLARQLIVVTSPDWNASQAVLRRFERVSTAKPFSPVGKPLTAFLGRSGLAWRSDAGAPPPMAPGPLKREGDGRSPAGFLTFGEAWGYAEKPPAGLRIAYHQADARTRCVDDAQSPSYGQVLALPPGLEPGKEPWRSAELLRLPTDHYKYLVIIDYNMQKPRALAGSCIFLHVAPRPATATSGCTALYEEDLLALLRFIDPQKRPLLLQLPKDVLAIALQSKELASVLPVALVQ
jgi:L,D-peptidoglycan transpeptidase YkuD (ErfK/YbiS/YcfS/YnhG family)